MRSVYSMAFEPIVVSRVTSVPCGGDSLSGVRSARQRRWTRVREQEGEGARNWVLLKGNLSAWNSNDCHLTGLLCEGHLHALAYDRIEILCTVSPLFIFKHFLQRPQFSVLASLLAHRAHWSPPGCFSSFLQEITRRKRDQRERARHSR